MAFINNTDMSGQSHTYCDCKCDGVQLQLPQVAAEHGADETDQKHHQLGQELERDRKQKVTYDRQPSQRERSAIRGTPTPGNQLIRSEAPGSGSTASSRREGAGPGGLLQNIGKPVGNCYQNRIFKRFLAFQTYFPFRFSCHRSHVYFS